MSRTEEIIIEIEDIADSLKWKSSAGIASSAYQIRLLTNELREINGMEQIELGENPLIALISKIRNHE